MFTQRQLAMRAALSLLLNTALWSTPAPSVREVSYRYTRGYGNRSQYVKAKRHRARR